MIIKKKPKTKMVIKKKAKKKSMKTKPPNLKNIC